MQCETIGCEYLNSLKPQLLRIVRLLSVVWTQAIIECMFDFASNWCRIN